MQQILAYETDLLEYEDLFDGSHVVAAKVAELKDGAYAELKRIEALGGAVAAVESGDLKEKLVESNRKRTLAVEKGELPVVGVNRYVEGEPSPLSAGEGAVMSVEFRVEAEQVARLKAWRAARDSSAAEAALAALESDARADANIMPATLVCAKAGVTTGEWAQALRSVYGEYRAPTGVALVIESSDIEDDEKLRKDVARVSERLGRTLTIVVGKPGLDGHSNGAEQIAARARSLGMNAIYEGIRLTPAQIVAAAKEHKAHAVGLSILSGSHLDLVREVVQLLRAEGLNAPVFVGGIIPPADGQALAQMGVAGVYTPKDYKITSIMGEMVRVVEARAFTPVR
jgi:(2R)-ethylmalonyl-CoA mutase